MSIIFYDIPSTFPGNAWSPNAWKARHVLNYKGLSYKTEWLEFPDIEPTFVKLGIAPTGKKPDGTPWYTVPAIHDTVTGAYISDSFEIALYLEKTYPDTPKVFPFGSVGLQGAFTAAFMGQMNALWQFMLPTQCPKLHPCSEAHFRKGREADFRIQNIDDILPKGANKALELAKYKEGLGVVSSWYKLTEKDGPFFLGETVSWADLVVGSYALWGRLVWGEDSEEWKDIESWHGGRWTAILANLEKYRAVV